MVGYKLGRAISDIVARANMQVRQAMLRPEQAEIARRHTSQMEIWERELQPLLDQLYSWLPEQEGASDELKELFRRLGVARNQTDLIVRLLGIAGAVFAVPTAAASSLAQEARNHSFHRFPDVPLDAAVAADGVARGRLDPGYAADQARMSGTDGPEFASMVSVARRAMPVELAIRAVQRGKADAGHVVAAAKDAGMDDNAAGVVANLVYSPISADQAVAAAVEGHIDLGAMAELLRQNGVDPQWAQTLYDTYGRPPGIAELLQLVNRGIIDEGRVGQAIRESNIKDKYIPDILQMRVYLPPARSIVAMMRSGAIDTNRGQQLLQQHGLSAEDSAAFVREATHGRTQQAKEIAASTALSMFAEQEIDRAQCAAILSNLHYDSHSADLLLADAETRRERKERDALATRIRSQLVSKHISRSEASNALDRAGVGSARRDMLLRLWELEAASVRPVLSVAQLNSAHRKGVISDQQLTQYLLRLGFSTDDAKVLVETQGGTYTP